MTTRVRTYHAHATTHDGEPFTHLIHHLPSMAIMMCHKTASQGWRPFYTMERNQLQNLGCATHDDIPQLLLTWYDTIEPTESDLD